MTPHSWQREFVAIAVPDLLDVRDGRAPPGLLSAVTGAGKTVAIALMLRALIEEGEAPARIVVVTSRVLLVGDIARAVAAQDIDVGVWTGVEKRLGRVVVTTYDSLPVVLAGGCDLLVCDEAHHSAAPVADPLVRSIPWRIGATATPFLGAKSATIPAFERVIYTVTRDEALRNGWIVPHKIEVLTAREYAAVPDLGTDTPRALAGLIAMIKARGGSAAMGPGMVTAPDLATARSMVRVLGEHGVRAAAVGMDTPRAERQAAIEGSRRGDVDALVTVVLLTEGVDLPWLRWAGVCAWIGDAGRVFLAQFIGRIVRACPLDRYPEQGHLGAKTHALILDPGRIILDRVLDHDARLGGERPKPLPKDPVKRAVACVARLEDLPKAVAVAQVEVWAHTLRDYALAQRPDLRLIVGHHMSVSERHFPASDQQWADLRWAWKRGAAAVFPRQHREMVSLMVERGRVNRGVVADLRIFATFAAGRERDRAQMRRIATPMGRAPRTAQEHAAMARVGELRIELPDDVPLPGETTSDER